MGADRGFAEFLVTVLSDGQTKTFPLEQPFGCLVIDDDHFLAPSLLINLNGPRKFKPTSYIASNQHDTVDLGVIKFSWCMILILANNSRGYNEHPRTGVRNQA